MSSIHKNVDKCFIKSVQTLINEIRIVSHKNWLWTPKGFHLKYYCIALSRIPITSLAGFQVIQSHAKLSMQNQGKEYIENVGQFLNSIKPIYEINNLFQPLKVLVYQGSRDAKQQENIHMHLKPKEDVLTLLTVIDPDAYNNEALEVLSKYQALFQQHPMLKTQISLVFLVTNLPKVSIKNEFETQLGFAEYYLMDGEIFDKDYFFIKSPYTLCISKQKYILGNFNPLTTDLAIIVQQLIDGNTIKPENQDQGNVQKDNTMESPHELGVFLIEKEQYQKCEQKLQHLNSFLLSLNLSNYSQLNISLKKEKVLSHGKVQQIKRHPVRVSCQFIVEDKEAMDKLVQIMGEEFETEQIEFDQLVVQNVLEEQFKICEIAKQACQSQGIRLNYEILRKRKYYFSNQLGDFKMYESFKVVTKVSRSTEEKVQKAMHELDQYINSITNTDVTMIGYLLRNEISYAQRLVVGDSFQSIDCYQKFEKQIEQIEFNGIPLIIIYWAPWCDVSYSNLIRNNEIIQKNSEKWANKVRIITLSLEKRNQCSYFLNSCPKAESNYEMYYPSDENLKDIKTYGANSTPWAVVVDQSGIIVHLGDLYDLTEFAESLANTGCLPYEEIQQNQVKETIIKLQPKEVDQVFKIFTQQSTSKILANVGGEQEFIFEMELIEHYPEIRDNAPIKVELVQLYYYVQESKLPLLQSLVGQLGQIIPLEKFPRKHQEIGKQITIPFPGEQCTLCQCELNKQTPQYFSPFSAKFYCCKCAEFEDNLLKGFQKYKCDDNLIFINAPLLDESVLKNINANKIGKNLKVGKFSQQHQEVCNGCGVEILGLRYIALNCRPGKLGNEGFVDFCQSCFIILKDQKSAAAQAIISKLEGDKINQSELFMRILSYSEGGHMEN